MERKFGPFGQSAKSASSVENIRDPQTYAIIGAAMEVHRVLGCGFLEPVYQEALAKEFLFRGIAFRREIELPVIYKGELLAVKYKPDFICYDAVVVELKALDKLSGKEKAQMINYLKATALERGLLLNFGIMRSMCRRSPRPAANGKSLPGVARSRAGGATAGNSSTSRRNGR
jgi:GxxExxY protein